MAPSAEDYLESFTTFPSPPASRAEDARSHRAGINELLDTHLGVRGILETGSRHHDTQAGPHGVSDFIVPLKGKRPGSAVAALTDVKNHLHAKYPLTPITMSRPLIICRFPDDPIAIIPAYPAPEPRGLDGGYWIADTTGGWMRTHPEAHNEYLQQVNQATDGAARKLTIQAKTWKRAHAVPVCSYYLETRAAQYIQIQHYCSPLWDLHGFLAELLATGLCPVTHPCGPRIEAAATVSAHAEALLKLRTAVHHAAAAKDHYLVNRQDDAITELKHCLDPELKPAAPEHMARPRRPAILHQRL